MKIVKIKLESLKHALTQSVAFLQRIDTSFNLNARDDQNLCRDRLSVPGMHW